MLFRYICLIVSLCTLALMGCGGESTVEHVTEVLPSNVKSVSSVSDLPECSSENEGAQLWVQGEPSVRICVDGKWFGLYADDEKTVSCIMEKMNVENGFKVVCNGDSVGSVMYDVEPGEDKVEQDKGEVKDILVEGTSCSLRKIDNGSAWVVCGSDSTLFDMGPHDILDSAENIELDSERVAVSVDLITGFSQKGPFLNGSKVVVRELQDGRTLAQTGNSFNGKILNEKGEFKINARNLVSQYVTLEATGFYRDEVTGENSGSQITLFAISDVSARNGVNLNLLTHLEYERVIYLVTQKKMRVKNAKKQAQTEIFSILGIDATDFNNSEDLDISGATDEDAALLAFSVMLLGGRSVADLSALLQKMATDMEKDGVWDDEKTKMAIADWCADADGAGILDSIRNHVKNWALSDTVPQFERYVRNFWYAEYGLDSCSVEKNGVFATASAGKYKDSKNRYVCTNVADDDAAVEFRWVIVGDLEKDVLDWNDSVDGALKPGNVTGRMYVFDSLGILSGVAGWRLANDFEKVYGGCGSSLYGEIRRDTTKEINGVYDFYQCADSSHKWEKLNSYYSYIQLMIDLQGWESAEDGTSRWGDSIGVVSAVPMYSSGNDADTVRRCYVYDTTSYYNGWHRVYDNSCILGLGGCTIGRTGMIVQSDYDNKFYKCSNSYWGLASKAEYNTIGYACDEDAKIMFGVVDKKSRFICDGGTWRAMSVDEEKTGAICTKGLQGTFNEDSSLVCDTSTFRMTNVYDFDVGARNYFNPEKYYGSFTDGRDGRVYATITIGNKIWMAENLKYSDSIATPNLKGSSFCHMEDTLNCLKGGRLYGWTGAMNIDSKWGSATTPSGLITEPHRGICPEGWHIPNYSELNSLRSYGATALQATKNVRWPNATNSTGFTALPVGNFGTYERVRQGDIYKRVLVASNVGTETSYFSSAEAGTNSLSSNVYVLVVTINAYTNRNSAEIVADNNAHTKGARQSVRCVKDEASEKELDTNGWPDGQEGDVKNSSLHTNVYPYYTNTYVFQGGEWRLGTSLDSLLVQAGGSACLVNGDTSTVKYDSVYYVCTEQSSGDVSRKWEIAPDIYNDTYESRGECKADGLYGNGEILAGRVHPENKYVCDNGEFRLANETEIFWNRGCVSYILGESYELGESLSKQKCTESGWVLDDSAED